MVFQPHHQEVSANRKRRRLKKRASMLSKDDLFELCRMRDLNPDNMADDEEALGSDANDVEAERTACRSDP